MRMVMHRSVLTILAALALAGSSIAPLQAKPPAKPAPAAPAAAPEPPVGASPQQTTASYGDWVVRCVTAGTPAVKSCEAGQSLVATSQGRQVPVAQVAVAPLKGRQTVTLLLPINIAFDKPPQIGADATHLMTLTYRRCLPNGCFASGEPDAAMLAALRGAAKPGRIVFTDAAERTIALPLSLRGLAQALDALAKEAP